MTKEQIQAKAEEYASMQFTKKFYQMEHKFAVEDFTAGAEWMAGEREEADRQWISVKDRLPGKPGYYLVYDENAFGEKRDMARFSNSTEERWFQSNTADEIHPSFWMPLPPKPESK